jgi:hypothetical protein
MTEQDQKKLVVVFGATGTQGGSVIKALQADPVTAREWRIRGITRDTSKPSAQALREKGVETVTVSLFFLSLKFFHRKFKGGEGKKEPQQLLLASLRKRNLLPLSYYDAAASCPVASLILFI